VTPNRQPTPPDVGRGPAPDLFDLAPTKGPARYSAPVGSVAAPRSQAARSPAQPQSLGFARLAGRAGALGVGGLLFGFPLWLTTAFACAGVIGELFAQWRRIRRFFWTSVLAAFCAQSTSLFISPFTWPLRFGFFFVLIGVVVVFWAQQTDGLD
jgi:hypothetical protein